MPELGKEDTPIRRPTAGRDPISAVKMSERLTADVDAWAEAHDTVRSDAIRRLVELGLSASPTCAAANCAAAGHCSIQSRRDRGCWQSSRSTSCSIHRFPAAERERRIRRLTEGPPEFIDERIDLPKPRK